MIFSGSLLAQQKQQEKEKYAEIPNEYGSVFIMNQPKAPLTFEEVDSYIRLDERIPQIRFVLKNKTRKKVVSFTVVFRRKSNVKEWASLGLGFERKVGDQKDGAEIIAPYGSYKNIERNAFDLAPIDSQIADLFNPKNGQRAKVLWVGMIEKVVFDDGTIFDTGKAGDEIIDFLF